VPLSISQASILAANSGQSLSMGSVGTPTNGGQLTTNGSSYSFVSNTLGNSVFSYTISDSTGASASSTITVHVLAAGSVTGAFYGTDDAGDIYEFDSTGAFQLALTTTYNGSSLGFDDLAIDATGTLYGKSSTGTGEALYTVNGNTGVATLVLSSLIPSMPHPLCGLSFLPDGRIVTGVSMDLSSSNEGCDGPTTLVAVNLTTSAVTTLVPQSQGYSMNGGDVKYLPNGNLYWTVANGPGSLCGGSGNQDIVTVNPSSGAVAEIGCLSQSNVFGLGFAFGELYGFSGNGNLDQINILTAKVALVKATGDSFAGGASNPALW
jgi:hypothetical protein